jgi:hypothetical protein
VGVIKQEASKQDHNYYYKIRIVSGAYSAYLMIVDSFFVIKLNVARSDSSFVLIATLSVDFLFGSSQAPQTLNTRSNNCKIN